MSIWCGSSVVSGRLGAVVGPDRPGPDQLDVELTWSRDGRKAGQLSRIGRPSSSRASRRKTTVFGMPEQGTGAVRSIPS